MASQEGFAVSSPQEELIASRSQPDIPKSICWRIEMRMKLAKHLSFSVILLTLCVPLSAHHGNSAYDETHPITITGTVTEFVWSNPHCQIYLDIKDPKGATVNWGVETMSPGILTREGWTKSTLKPGDEVSITLIPAKNGAPVGYTGNGVSYTAGVYTQLKVVRASGGDPIPPFTIRKPSN
jgi:hypothetical protein